MVVRHQTLNFTSQAPYAFKCPIFDTPKNEAMKYLTLFIYVLFSLSAAAQTPPKPKTTASKPAATKPATAAPVLKNALDSFSYALGMSVGSFCNQQQITNVNTALLVKGVNDGTKPEKALMTEQQMSMVISNYLNKRNAEKTAAVKAEGKKFLEDNARKAGVVTLASGLQYQVLKAGTDTTKPKLTDTVRCHYTGMTIDGNVFESSVQNGQPVEFAVTGVIQGWIEALQMMTVGSKWRLFIPPDLGYGDQARNAPFPPGSTLIFDVELLEIVNK